MRGGLKDVHVAKSLEKVQPVVRRQGAGARDKSVDRVGMVGGRLTKAIPEAPEGVEGPLDEEALFVAEVMVEGRRLHPGVGQDLGDAHFAVGPLLEQSAGSPQKPLAST